MASGKSTSTERTIQCRERELRTEREATGAIASCGTVTGLVFGEKIAD